MEKKMGRLTKEERDAKEEHARILYTRENVTNQKELAQRVGVGEKTISDWINTGNWKKFQRNLILTREEQLANLHEELVEINQSIKNKSEGSRFADNKMANVRRFLIKDIRELETDTLTADYITAFTQLINFVKKDDLEAGKLIGFHADKFIKTKLR